MLAVHIHLQLGTGCDFAAMKDNFLGFTSDMYDLLLADVLLADLLLDKHCNT